MHTDIPDALLVPGAEPVALTAPVLPDQDASDREAAASDISRQDAPDHNDSDQNAGIPDTETPDVSELDAAIQEKEAQQFARDSLHRRKRRVAFLAVLVVAVIVPAIVLALLLG